ncbi:uncharacterized protein LOC143850040 [Tasmannia lanceolata]|uniref:uncharacterized protein LOC143850040 n=1 Tax=Tasmannia lanceolata TaxID=3420 RepID=UPI004062AE43
MEVVDNGLCQICILFNYLKWDCEGIFWELERTSTGRPHVAVLIYHDRGGTQAKAEHKGNFTGLKTSRNSLAICHIQFADDPLVLIEEDGELVIDLKRVFLWFEICSGLKINFSKSALAGVNEDLDVVKKHADKIGCCDKVLPMTYLGLPLGYGVPSKAQWDPVVERIERKLATWKTKYISFEGRITLIKAGLSNTPVYFMSLYKIPVKIAQRIEKL